MKTTTTVLATAITAVGCSTGPGASDSTAAGVAIAQQAQIAAPMMTTLTQESTRVQFSLASSRARTLIPTGTISRRVPGGRICTGSLARISFANSDAGTAMRAAAERLLSSPKFGLAAESLHSLKLKTNEGLLLLPVQAGGAIAYSVPESGTFTLKRGHVEDHESVVKTTEDAVNAALDGIAKHGLLALGPQESLDVVGVTARFHNTMSDTGPIGAGEKVGYQVLLGRTYRGTQVLGPPSLVTLDSDGDVATFRKGWRDITGEAGAVDVAADTEIEGRRDKLMMQYLTLKEATCGYTEDPDPASIQGSAGVGCHYVYKDTDAHEAMNREVDEWVNAASDSSIRMYGVKKTPSGTL